MTDRLLYETRISLTQLAQEQNKSVQTCWRWTGRGVKRHVLESFSVGGRRYTTREAFERWIVATNGEHVVRGDTPGQRKRKSQRLDRRADKLGL